MNTFAFRPFATHIRRCAMLCIATALLPAIPLFTHAQSEGAWVNGITEPVNDVTLSAPLAGIIGKRHFEEGDFVSQGQVIIELDKRIEELEVNRRQLVMDLAKNDLDGTRALFEKNAISISRDEMDKKVAEYNVSVVEHQLAEEQLRKRQIGAPFDGTIVELFLKVGEACQPQQALVRLVDARRCYFVSNIDATIGHSLKVGQPIQLAVESGISSVQVDGTLAFVSPVVDPASGLMRVKVLFENPEGKIRPGVAGKMFIAARN